MAMELKGHRSERFRYDLYTRDQQYIRILTTVKGGEINWNIFSRIVSTASLDMVWDPNIDFLNDRIAIFREIKTTGEWQEYPLGVFLAATPGLRKRVAVEQTVSLYDKLLILEQDRVDTSYTVAEGTNVVEAIVAVIQSAGENQASIEESDQIITSARVWPAGTDKLTICNDLLSSINYFQLTVDGTGAFRSRRYIPPGQRPVAEVFYDDERSIYTSDIDLEADYFYVPNKVILISSDPEVELVVTDTLDRLLPSSPFSYAKRGRWITRVEEVEATSQTVLEGMAERMLLEGVQVIERVTYNHAWVPISPHDAVLFRNTAMGVNAKYTVVSQDISLRAGGLVQSTIRRVVT